MSKFPAKDLTTAPPIGRKCVLFFWASWHQPSNTGGSVDTVFASLSSAAGEVVDFYRIEAEAQPDLSLKYGVTVVPTFVLIDEAGDVFDRVEGGDDIPRLTQAVSALSSRSTVPVQKGNEDPLPAAPDEGNINSRLKSLINSSEVMLFMKGNPAAPRCGFSRKAVELLSDAKIVYGTFDILTDEDVRQGLKTYSDWPTYPQLYVKGELVGGLDIMKEMAEEGNLATQLGVGIDSSTTEASSEELSLENRLKELVKRKKVMLFMKGLPSAPRCGFSRQIVEILNKFDVSYEAFDILTDEEVRQGLKKLSDWPTYPQLYVNGDLIGGLDIVKELDESGDLVDALNG